MDALIGLLWAIAALGVIGLVRSIAQFGEPGLIAFLKLIAAPAVVTLVWFVAGPLGITTWDDSGKRSLLPPESIWKPVAIFIAVITCILLVISAMVGVGWLVQK